MTSESEKSEISLLTAGQIGELTGWKPNTVYNKPRLDPTFPRPIKLQEHAKGARHAGSRWLKSEVLWWLEQRKAARDQPKVVELAKRHIAVER